MFRSYLTIAVRTLRRNLGYTVINLIGLAVGMAACLLIGLYVRFELSYDTFHAKSDRIYRAVEKSGFRPDDVQWNATVTGLLASTARTEFSGVEDAVRMRESSLRVRHESETYPDVKAFFAESNLFNIFSFDVRQGDPSTVLDRPKTVVLTASMAERLFGSADPIGKTIRVDVRDSLSTFEVTGVMADVPSNSHLQFDVLVSFSTLLGTRLSIDANQFLTYLRLDEQHPPVDALGDRILTYNRDTLGKEYVKDARLQPLGEIYFGSAFMAGPGDVRYVYVFAAIAIIILLIACANYMNLATARSTKRIREVGVRRTMGALRSQLARQFLGESLLLALLALPMALGLLAAALPTFNRLAGTGIQLGLIGVPVWLALVGVAVVVGLIAGSYPALFLSKFQPTQVLTGQLPVGWDGARLRKALIVVQFALSAALIFSTAIILRQMHFVQQKKLGFDQERVVTAELRDSAFRQQAEAFRQEVARLPAIRNAALADGAPAVGFFGRVGHVFDWKGGALRMQRAFIDSQFLNAMDVKLLAGRTFTPQEIEAGRESRFSLQKGSSVILNETAVEALGWATPEDAVGQVVEPFAEKTVIGVVEDFHFRSLRQPIEPLALEPGGQMTLVARLAPGNVSEALDQLRATWGDFAPDTPFSYHFLDEQIDQLYRSEQRTATIIGGFAGLAVLLACMGLFGLAAYAAERRTKEIGIRKALGASAANIVALLSKDFLLLVAVACAIGAPAAYVAMERWLQDFAYRIDVNPLLFVGATVLAVLIALGSISAQALRAARTDPAEALRYE